MSKVTALGMDTITEKSGHQMTGMAVSVCTTPAAPSPVPIPYPTAGTVAEGITDPPMRTKINGAKILTVGGCMKACHGNEPGTLKEVVSLNTAGPCFPWLGAPNVLIELGMAGITGSMGQMNKSVTVGAGASGSGAGNAGGRGGGSTGGGAGAPGGGGPQGPRGGGGGGGGTSHQGASGPPGSSSAPPDAHTCQDGHPVNVATGDVVDQAVDLDLPGLIPLIWRRYYSSARSGDAAASLGPGWAHGFEQRITEDERALTLRDAEGRSIYFAKAAAGESTFHRRERLVLSRERDGTLHVYSLDTRRTHVFSADAPAGPARLRAIRDAWGNAIALDYEGRELRRVVDTAGREVKVAWKDGRISRLEVWSERRLWLWVEYRYYTGSGCLFAAVDALGNADTYEYDRERRMVATTIKTGARFQYAYGDSGRCVKTWGPEGLYEISLRADSRARITAVEGEEPRVYAWNEHGLMTREALPDGTVIEERAYDKDGFLIAEADGEGAGTEHWYDERGNRIRSVDAEGGYTTTVYDERDLPVRRVTPDGLETRFAHDERGALTEIVEPSGRTMWLTWDARGRLTAIHNAEGLVRAWEYNEHHNVVAETDERGARTTYTYDGLGRAISRVDALGRETRVHHDGLGRPLHVFFPDGTKLTRLRDAAGNVVREVDALGRATLMGYAGMGVLAWLKDAEGREWRFEYTSKERLRAIKNPRGEVYSFERDDAGRVRREQTFDGRELRYHWTGAGRVREIHYPDKTWRLFGYDRRGLLTSERASDGSNVSYGRDRRGRVFAAVLEEDSGELVETRIERDALGRVTVERQGDLAIRYGYDARGRRVERVMPNGARTRYAYDAAGALVGVEHGGVTIGIERDLLGREVARGNADVGLVIRSACDAMDRLIEQRATAPAPGEGVPAVLLSRRWERDGAGRVTRVEDARWGATAYRYSRGGDLVEAARGAHREVFAYDGAGALVQVLEGLEAQVTPADVWWTGGRSPRWTTAPGNVLRQTDRHRYAYDARSRRVGKCEMAAGSNEKATGADGAARPEREARETRYAWDVRDRLREVLLPSGERMRMTYDAFGRRVRKEVIGASGQTARALTFVWDGDALAGEVDRERGARCFVHEPGTLVPLLQAERGDVFAYVNDPLGTPKELIDDKGLVAWSAAHSAWGKVVETYGDRISGLNHRGEVSSPFRLLGQYEDEETGLCSTRFRYFDPEVGRWLSSDPLGVLGGLELFGFDGCAVNESDPLGLTTGNPHDHDLPANLLKDPKSIWGKSSQEIADVFGRAGYKATIEPSTKGSKLSTQIRISGHPEISNIQVHPGGGRHEGAYYKISTSTQGKIKVVDPDSYVPTPGEKATIVPFK
ncbi:DUF6531 domain-containing protein [Sorangium sp. So ce426]|uniref:DUF6531 domain-containing protein n=1 Tax=Sorangium sp. So ce426 TaxID=3133312 RepID=UPI003F5BE91C